MSFLLLCLVLEYPGYEKANMGPGWVSAFYLED